VTRVDNPGPPQAADREGVGAAAAAAISRTRARPGPLGLTLLCVGLIALCLGFIWLRFPQAMLLWIAVAAVVTVGYQRARSHSEQYRKLLDDLVTTRQALATREREAGRLAERERLARDIHDGVGQSLASVILLLRAARGPATAHAPAACIQQLDTALDTAMSALAETRRLVRGQDPVALEQGGLADALAAQAADCTALGLPTTLAVHGHPRRLDISAEVALLRAAQEALANARKHAAAHHATVTLTFQDDEVSVDVVDDGVGFATDEIAGHRPDGTGYGLTGMQTRLAERGGEVAIESEPGAGTAVRATVPAETA
jgi:signal transduction histidine kinase